jgi:uncharacterized protein (TIGR00297 family)
LPASSLQQIVIAAALAGMVAGLAGLCRALTLSGAVAAFAVGFFVFAFGGTAGAGALLAFFVSSSVLSAVGRARKARAGAQYAKGSRRDALQVLANGGVPALLCIWSQFSADARQTVLLAIAALAAANADTWATEIGGALSRGPRLISTLKRAEPGTSGAVSLIGLVAALAGAAFVVWVASLAWPRGSLLLFGRPDPAEALALVWAAFIATFADSVLGASVQAQYRCRTCGAAGEWTTHCGHPAERTRGLAWMTNDAVNLASIALGAAFAWFLLTQFAYPL